MRVLVVDDSITSRTLDEPEINLVSLIDVLFCLILFLVLTTSFNQRAALKIQLPQAQAGTVPDVGQPLIVLVDVDGKFFVGNTEVTQRGVVGLKASEFLLELERTRTGALPAQQARGAGRARGAHHGGMG